jgi:hypothetical protein
MKINSVIICEANICIFASLLGMFESHLGKQKLGRLRRKMKRRKSNDARM